MALTEAEKRQAAQKKAKGGRPALTGSDALKRSKKSAESETGHIDTSCKECTEWVGVTAVYDDIWHTPVTGRLVRIEVVGELVADGPRTASLADFGKEDGQPLDDVRSTLGGYDQHGVKSGAAIIKLVPDPGAMDTNVTQIEIITKLAAFEKSMQEYLQPWILEWQKNPLGSLVKGRFRGEREGFSAWWKGVLESWSGVGGLVQEAAIKTWDWYISLPWYEKLMPSLAFGREVGEFLVNQIKKYCFGAVILWEWKVPLAKLYLAFHVNSLEGIESALDELTGMPGEWGKLFQAIKSSVDWVMHLIEVVINSDTFSRVVNSVMAVLAIIPPNFIEEAMGLIEGYVMPEVLIAIGLILVSELSAGAGSAALVAHIAEMLSKIRSALKVVGRVGEFIVALFEKIEEIARLIGRLAKGFVSKISEVAEGVTSKFNKIVRGKRFRLSKGKRKHIINRHGPIRGKADRFPSHLTDEQIFQGVEKIANDPTKYKNGIIPTSGKHTIYGEIDGVPTTVEIWVERAGISTAYPTRSITP